MNLLWFYTTSSVEKALSIDVLKVTPIKSLIQFNRAIWLTKEPVFEFQVPDLIASDTPTLGNGQNDELIRFGIERYEGLITWDEYIEMTGADVEVIKSFDKRYKTHEANKSEWLFSTENIPKSKWVRIEMLKEKEWVKIWDNNEVVPNDSVKKDDTI